MIETLKIYVPQLLEVLTLASGLITVAFILLFIYSWASGRKQTLNSIAGWLKNNYLLFGLIVSAVATAGSLFYSNVMGFNPCTLCWWQRIFMYPQVLLFGIALWKKDVKIVRYALWLSVIGGLIAGYHYSLQIGFLSSNLPCSALGYSASCAELFLLAYGYLTIPMMALTVFIMLIILGLSARSRGNAINYI